MNLNQFNTNIEFTPFQKIGRLSREIIITEKIDGTNGVIQIDEDLNFIVGSRNQWIIPGKDNHGFLAWALKNQEELVAILGVGRHYGEWWGQGIARKYGLAEKRFSLFNVSRWADADKRPSCCHVVPELYRGDFDTEQVKFVMAKLALTGSIAAPGFMRPEGVVIYHGQSNSLFKKTYEKDQDGKGREPIQDMAA